MKMAQERILTPPLPSRPPAMPLMPVSLLLTAAITPATWVPWSPAGMLKPTRPSMKLLLPFAPPGMQAAARSGWSSCTPSSITATITLGEPAV